MDRINLEEFANGALSRQVNRAIEKVAENIQDPNTDPASARKITVTIVFKPNDLRDFVTTGVQTKTTLAPSTGAVTALSVGKNLKTGEVEAVEIGNQIPGQMTIPDEVIEEPEAPDMGKAYDQSTGEIYETPAGNVVDLRPKAHKA